jgi:hypothetical protein
VAELKILGGEKNVAVIEVKEDKIMLTRNSDFITLGGKFPRLTKEDAKAIRACSRQLWSKASGDDEGRCIDLKKAAPILLGFSKR